MFRVVLIDIFSVDNYGIRCVSANLKRHGFEVHNIFGTRIYQGTQRIHEGQYQGICKLIQDLRPSLVGMSVISTFSHPNAAEMAAKIKSCSDAPIIFGGAHPTLLPEWTLNNAEIDFVCIGDGEESLVELARALSSGQRNRSVPGIMSKVHCGYTARAPKRDLDDLPFQSFADERTYSVLEDGTVQLRDPGTTRSQYTTRCSRGCPFSCTFCSNQTLRSLCDGGKYVRRRSPRHVIEEIRHHLQFMPSCSSVSFTDDNFPFAPGWIEEFCERYRKYIGLPFRIWFHPNTLKEKQIALLAAAGLRWAKMGIQSGSDQTRRQVFGRSESREAILATDQTLTKHGVRKSYDFILNHPWESETELQDTHELLMKCKRPFSIGMHSLVLLPRTKLAARAIEEGLIDNEERLIEDMTSDAYSVSRRILWIGGIPDQEDLIREYRIRLLFSAQSPWMPKWLIEAALSPRILKSRRSVKYLLGAIKGGQLWIGRFRTGLRSAERAVRRPLKRFISRLISKGPRVAGGPAAQPSSPLPERRRSA
jgi:anaerobic magnesium-protoporphyrin IX monomethyl ester cyclase